MGCRSRPGACPSWPTTWSPRGWSTTSATRACGCCCARRASPFQAVKTWKTSTDPDYEAKKNRVLELYAIADGKAEPGPGDPDGGVLHGRVRAAEPAAPPRQAVGAAAVGRGDQRAPRRRRRRATYTPPARGAAPDGRLRPVHRPALRPRQDAARAAPSSSPSAATCAPCTRPRCGSRSCWTTSAPHLSTKTDSRVGDWAAANNVELAYVPFYGSWLNRIEAQFTALRYFALDGTDHPSHHEQASMIRRYIAWRNRHATDPTTPQSHQTSRHHQRAKVA